MNYNKKMNLIKGVKVFVGVDVGKDKHYVSVVDERGLLLKVGIPVENSRIGFEEFMRLLESMGKKDEIAIGMEPTGHYFKPLGYYLKERGYRLFLVNPYHVKLSKELRDNSKRKTDKKDSVIIAYLLKEGKFLQSRLLDGIYENLRRLTTMRERVVKEKTRNTIRLIRILDEYLPEFEDCFKDVTCKTALFILKKYGIRGLKDKGNSENIINDIVKVSSYSINEQRASQIVDTLMRTIGITEGIDSTEKELKLWVEIIERYRESIKEIEKEIEDILNETEEGKYLLSIKGVGVVTASVILGQTGSFRDFSNAKQIEKLAGLDLVEDSSGKKIGKKSISKRGRSLLRHGLYRVALASITHDNEFKGIYDYKVNVLKKNKMVALTDLSVKILRIMFALTKHKTMYDGNLVLDAIGCS